MIACQLTWCYILCYQNISLLDLLMSLSSFGHVWGFSNIVLSLCSLFQSVGMSNDNILSIVQHTVFYSECNAYFLSLFSCAHKLCFSSVIFLHPSTSKNYLSNIYCLNVIFEIAIVVWVKPVVGSLVVNHACNSSSWYLVLRIQHLLQFWVYISLSSIMT